MTTGIPQVDWSGIDSIDRKYFVYMVKTTRDWLYTGISVDPKARIKEHNTGKRGAKALRGQRPVRLIWFLDLALTKSNALKFESKIKRLSRKQKEAFLKGDLPLEIPE